MPFLKKNETFWGFSNNVALVKNCPLVFYNAVADYGKMRHTRRKTLKKMRSIAEQSSHPDSKIMLQYYSKSRKEKEGRKDRRKNEEMVKVSVKSFIERLASCRRPFLSDQDLMYLFPYLWLRKCRLSKQRYQYQLELAF